MQKDDILFRLIADEVYAHQNLEKEVYGVSQGHERVRVAQIAKSVGIVLSEREIDSVLKKVGGF